MAFATAKRHGGRKRGRRRQGRRLARGVRVVTGALLFAALVLAGGQLAASTLEGMLLNGTLVMPLPLPAAGNTQAGRDDAAMGTVRLAVEPLLQKPELPNGCEATSLATVLQYLGYAADKTEVAYGYMPREDFTDAGDTLFGPWPGEAYPGDPGTGRGFYCYAGPVAEAGNTFLAANEAPGTFADATGTGLTQLQGELEAGRPVIIWVTLTYFDELEYMDFSWRLPDGRTYIPYANLHCVVMAGFAGDEYFLCDPLLGEVTIDRATLAACYEAMGSRAVVYVP